jgi:hypothetical protein
VSLLGTEQQAVELDENSTGQANAEPRRPAWKSTRNVLACPVRRQVDQSERRTHTRAAVDHFKPGALEKGSMTRERKILEVVRVSVKRLKKGCRGKNAGARFENSEHLGHRMFGMHEVLENRLAVKRAETRLGKWEAVCIADDVHVRKRGEIQVEEMRVDAQRTASNRN